MGAENLSKPVIAAAVAEAKRDRSLASKIDAEWVLKQAVELHRRCMQEIKPVRNPKTGKQQYDDDGNAVFKFNAAAANRALELVGKHVNIGAFKEHVEVSGGLSLVERIQKGRERARMERFEDADGAWLPMFFLTDLGEATAHAVTPDGSPGSGHGPHLGSPAAEI